MVFGHWSKFCEHLKNFWFETKLNKFNIFTVLQKIDLTTLFTCFDYFVLVFFVLFSKSQKFENCDNFKVLSTLKFQLYFLFLYSELDVDSEKSVGEDSVSTYSMSRRFGITTHGSNISRMHLQVLFLTQSKKFWIRQIFSN